MKIIYNDVYHDIFMLSSDSQKCYRDNSVSIPLTIYPIVNVFCYHSIFVSLKVVYYYQFELRVGFIFNYSFVCFFCYRTIHELIIQISYCHMNHNDFVECHVLEECDSFKEFWWEILQHSLNMGVLSMSCARLRISSWLWVSGRKTNEVRCYSRHIMLGNIRQRLVSIWII